MFELIKVVLFPDCVLNLEEVELGSNELDLGVVVLDPFDVLVLVLAVETVDSVDVLNLETGELELILELGIVVETIAPGEVIDIDSVELNSVGVFDPETVELPIDMLELDEI
uniref:Uncharacterized protein n=1 Tax=Acrobeloides nanus TaxID=290746 RepID=A0A914EHW5_9BILA